MAIPRILPAVLGVISILPTAAILAIHSILARSREDRAPAVRTTAIIAAILEATVLAAVTGLTCAHIGPWSARWAKFNGLWFGTGLFLCTVAAAVSVANMICLSKVDEDPESTILGSGATSFLVGSSVVLGLAFATQLVFLVFHFVAGRAQGPRIEVSVHKERNRNRSTPRVKSIAYHATSSSPASGKARGSASFEKTPPGSSAGRSTAETISSIRSSLSNAVRPISSKTRLLSQRGRRPASLELPSFHERPRMEEGFDSWDTSAVDPQNRQTVLESSSPPLGRFLETIPASPTTSRSPSPGTPLDLLEPPSRARRRSRTLSPAPSRVSQAQRTAFTQHSTQSESHIHPLFRSDSPIPPPPIVTPGTVVVAAPNGGQTLSDRQSLRSIRSLQRMRSGSLPGVPSPLSRQGSVESFHRKPDNHSPEIREEDEYLTPEEGTTPVVGTERKMTPPIPDWILSAGARSSLTTYTSRKVHEEASGASAANAQ
ncbi:hypothetical protein QBC40DRAFT_164638 [Triangularia verruculosa]|uniref:Uncharacterized protein n=1 Tax=Triangularia verruculosa TaxID=2587418 RepID=A0AAN6XPW9_9PEZI|nr:hypothetical protein QBC40DRAFT_164638 [Triangularia verruculosa]